MQKRNRSVRKTAKKHLAAIIAITVISAGAGTVYGALQSQDPYMGEDPIAEEDANNTQVLLQGKGYSLDKSQKKKYDLPQKIEKKDRENAANNGFPFHNNHNTQHPYQGHRPTHYNTQKYLPTIETDLKTQNYTAGKELNFYVKAKTYAGKPIDDSGIQVASSLSIKGPVKDNKQQYNYSVTIPEGRNIIRIVVTDKAKRTSAFKAFLINGVNSQDPTNPTNPTGPTDPTDPTGPTDPTDPTGPTETAKYTVSASITTEGLVENCGAEAEISETVSFQCKEGTKASKVIEKITSAFDNDGYIITPSASKPESLVLPDWITIVDPGGEPVIDPETGEETAATVDIDTISAEVFAEYGKTGKWVVKNKPTDKLDGDINMTIVFKIK